MADGTCFVTVRVSTSTKDAWKKVAASKGLSVGKMLQLAVSQMSGTVAPSYGSTVSQLDGGTVVPQDRVTVTQKSKPHAPNCTCLVCAGGKKK